jgi:polar amino acid transport system substrate-binding protein
MARLTGLRGFLCVVIATVWTLGGGAAAEPLRLLTSRLLPFQNLDDDKTPGFSVEVLRRVFAAMDQDASFENFPWDRSWRMMLRGERDGMVTVLPTSDRERICSFPDEPLKHERWVLFVRTADIATLKFSSFDDLVGHDVAVHSPADGVFEQPTVSPELWKFLREHHTMVETSGGSESLRMLAAGHVDYAVVNLTVGRRDAAVIGLSGKVEPILSRSVIEDGFSVCFSKARVSPSLVEAFSRALKEFKQTEAFQAIYGKYFP